MCYTCTYGTPLTISTKLNCIPAHKQVTNEAIGVCVCVQYPYWARIGYTTPTRTIHISSAISSYSKGYVTMVAEDKRVHIVRVHVGVVYLTCTQGSIKAPPSNNQMHGALQPNLSLYSRKS